MIYILHRDPLTAARMLADEEVITSIPQVAASLQGADMLLSGIGEHDNFTHWAASDEHAYYWALAFFAALLVTYSRRLNRVHHSSILLHDLFFAPETIAKVGYARPPPQSVARKYRGGDPIQAYREAYFDCAKQPHWSAPDQMPEWFSERLEQALRDEYERR